MSPPCATPASPRSRPGLALLAAGSEAVATPDGNGFGLFEEALAIPGVDRFPFDLADHRLRNPHTRLLCRTR
jgi:hypothetical protein